MALLEHDLALIDADGFPAYLESSNPPTTTATRASDSMPLGEFAYPGGGPVVTTMWRHAR